QTLVQYAGKWKISEDPLPLLEVYTVAIQSYSKARPYLTSECENVCFVLDRLALSCTELLLCLPDEVPDKLWEQFQASVQAAHKILLEYANPELQMLATLAQEGAVWKNSILDNIFSQQSMEQDKVSEFLLQEGPALLEMRIRHLVKEKRIDQAMKLAKLCTDHPEIGTKSIFKQTYLTCLCAASPNETLMEEISTVDCKDALEMICNLESDGEEKTALILCTTFLTRQLQQGDLYCAWELTLFWSKLQQRMEPSAQTFLECCRQFSMLSKTAGEAGLSSCIELCVRALRMESNENPTVKTSICKTISCLLPDDLEVRRACQLTEFLLEPTVEAYYAVETLYNQPDQKYDDENGPIPNSLRCELLLVLKTHWPFDPEFWDWKTLKRHCLALMGEEASIVSSIDELNDSDLFDENNESHNEVEAKEHSLNGLPKFYSDMVKVQNYSPEAMIIKKEKEEKKIERGVVSARFKNWQAYMQYCVLCDREFLGHRIIRHAQTHMKDGNYYCPICAKSFKKKEIFVPHVTFHIKQSCKERLAAIKPKRRVGRPPKNITDNSASPKMTAIDKQEHRPIKRNSLYATQKVDCTEDYNCPVTICTKTFKYFKNLIAHVKGHSNEEEAKQFLKMQSNKVVCQYCRRRFVSVSHLNEHLQIHCGPKPYVCIQLECSASFGTYSELVGHRKEHILFKAKCMFQNCGRIFTESYLLYDHEAQHYHSSSYTCRYPNCGKICFSQSEIQKHEAGHVANVRIKTEDQNSSSFESSQITDNATEQVGNQIDQLLETIVENNKTVKQFDINNYDMSLTYENVETVGGEVVESLQRFNCKVEGCSRSYTLARSVSKHIKAVHPEYYEALKKKENLAKVQRIRNPLKCQNQDKPANPSCLPDEQITNMLSESSQNASKTFDTRIAELLMGLQNLNLESDAKLFSSNGMHGSSMNIMAHASTNHCTENPDLINPCLTTPQTNTQQEIAQTENNKELKVNLVKPFVCQDEGCIYSAMTKDALTNHYVKVHQYSRERIMEIKMYQTRFAPFRCHVPNCQKTFTRNSNLRAHYQSVHHVAREELVKLRIKRAYCRKPEGSDKTAESVQPVKEIISQPAIINSQEKDSKCHTELESVAIGPNEFGEKKRRKAITKIKAQYDANKFHKPYKCVHKGCSAAFTIQQNLILHYRAVHQSDQHLLLRSEIKEESTQNESIQIRKEFSCQLDDCCRIFQGVTDLIKHYAELHDLALDEMGKLVSSMSEGKFHCDQAQCMSSFTVFWSFIKHLLVAHGIDVESKDSDQEMACFKCDCEGCDRTYATRSNLLRHIFTKHRELHRSHLMRPRRIIPTDQENIARTSYSSRKIGKYTFKSKAQALAMCSCKSLREQFPCMFESCSSVVTSESSLVKHYRIHHKISNTFVSQYYNHLVTCRTYSSAQGKESTEYVSNGQEGSVENAIYGDVVQQQVKLSETEILNKRVEKNDLLKSSFDELSEMFNAKLVNDTNGSAENKTGLEKMVEVSADNKFTNVNNHQPCKKRSNIHLTHSDIEKECVQSKKKKNLVMEKPEQLLEDNVNRTLHEKVASPAPDNSPCLNKGQHHKTFDLSTFKPMGFEVSFLKFLEESAVKRKRKPVAYKGPCHSGSTANAGKMADGGLHSSKVMAGNNSSSATRAMRGDERSGVPFNHSKESAVNRLCVETTEPQTLTNFSNPLSLHILKNIKVIMDKTHLDCVELAQKQLQRMQPTVVLSRIKVDVNMLAQVKRMKESIALKSK
uniref:Zinc finger protein 292 n=1 Tax=Callorhinchus milii TaxID=7868 RepID=A0A4W3IM58_CALMI